MASPKDLSELFSEIFNLPRRQKASAIKMDGFCPASSLHLHSSHQYHSMQLTKKYRRIEAESLCVIIFVRDSFPDTIRYDLFSCITTFCNINSESYPVIIVRHIFKLMISPKQSAISGVPPKLSIRRMYVSALNRTHLCIRKILPRNIHSIVFVNILSMSRKFDFFSEKIDNDVLVEFPTQWSRDQSACLSSGKDFRVGPSRANLLVCLVRMQSPTRR
jgi:hypothetical protein